MCFEDFQLLDASKNDDLIIERVFMKMYHQLGARLNDPNLGMDLNFDETNNYHEIGIGYFEFQKVLRKILLLLLVILLKTLMNPSN